MMNNKIGIFDSGIGGFTVAKAINNLLPNEDLFYFGDTAHLPYGDKPEKTIQNYSLKIAEFLLQHKVKIIVIACNSASAVAYQTLQKKYGKIVPIISMVEPIVEYIGNLSYKKIGVIGTKATIKSEIYKNKILKNNPSTKVESVASPLLAPMIEEGFYNNNISKPIINNYLSNYKLKNIKALILACTHYPLIKKEINTYYSKKIDIIDPSILIAKKVKNVLITNNLLKKNNKAGKHNFYVSNWTKSFGQSAKIFWGKEIKLIEANIWQ